MWWVVFSLSLSHFYCFIYSKVNQQAFTLVRWCPIYCLSGLFVGWLLVGFTNITWHYDFFVSRITLLFMVLYYYIVRPSTFLNHYTLFSNEFQSVFTPEKFLWKGCVGWKFKWEIFILVLDSFFLFGNYTNISFDFWILCFLYTYIYIYHMFSYSLF